jgi:hypothetical protein
MSQEPRTAPVSGKTEPCRECGVQMAADQRYCLNCGKRRGEQRLEDFRRHLPDAAAASTNGHPPQAAAPAPVAGAQPPAEQKPQRDFTPLAAAGGIAVLGLMLLVGVLIGRGDGEQAAAPPPQVVRVQGGGEEGGTAKADAGGSALGGAVGGGKAKGAGEGGKDVAKAAPPPPAITADDSELEALEGQSPQEYSESSAKLPDEIATEGAPPPEDDKKPGGGSAGATIE